MSQLTYATSPEVTEALKSGKPIVALAAHQPVSLGLRPEHMRLASADSTPNSLPARVDHIEKLGEASLLYLHLGANLPTITLKLEGTTHLRTGQAIRMQVDPGDLHLFDTAGEALQRTVSLPT